MRSIKSFADFINVRSKILTHFCISSTNIILLFMWLNTWIVWYANMTIPIISFEIIRLSFKHIFYFLVCSSLFTHFHKFVCFRETFLFCSFTSLSPLNNHRYVHKKCFESRLWHIRVFKSISTTKEYIWFSIIIVKNPKLKTDHQNVKSITM